MTGDIQRYIVDSNALRQLRRMVRSDMGFREIARFPSEVLHETGDQVARYNLSSLEYQTTPSVLRHIKDVMADVPANDFELIDLFAGEGAADPLLVACALDGAERRSQALVGEVYTVVTGDKAVRDACDRHDVEWLSAADFADRLSPKLGL